MIGRKTVNIDTQVAYVSGDTRYDTVYVDSLIPYKVEMPNKIITVYRDSIIRDTVTAYLETISDWNLIRQYSGQIFNNDSVGSLKYNATVQYNSLQRISTEFTPITRHITNTIKPQHRIEPYLSLSVNTLSMINASFGFKKNKLGYEIGYIKDIRNGDNGFTAGITIYF